MPQNFAQRFDAAYDLRQYQNAKGYRHEDDYVIWEPQYEVDLELEELPCGPGAMKKGELDDVYINNDEPELGNEEMQEF